MTPNYCVPYLGFNDESESSPSTCSISGNQATITSFKSLASNTLLRVMLRATNPSTGNLFPLLIDEIISKVCRPVVY